MRFIKKFIIGGIVIFSVGTFKPEFGLALAFFWLPWWVFFHKTKAEKTMQREREAEQRRREAEERRNRPPGLLDRIGRAIGNEMAKTYQATNSTRPCPTCGGKGKNTMWDSGTQNYRTSPCSLCAGRGYVYT